VVALVEYEPWAEELRLWDGEGRPNGLSESPVPTPVKMDLPSALPFNKDGALELWKLAFVPVLSRDCFRGLDVPEADFPRSEELRLADGVCVGPDAVEAVESLAPALGGCGKAAILTVRRKVLSGLFGANDAEVDRNTATVIEFDSPFAPSDGRDNTGDRSLEGEGDGIRSLSIGIDREGGLAADGMEGSGPDGGFVIGRGGWGRAEGEAIFAVHAEPGMDL
jgi:hypothetical protein